MYLLDYEVSVQQDIWTRNQLLDFIHIFAFHLKQYSTIQHNIIHYETSRNKHNRNMASDITSKKAAV